MPDRAHAHMPVLVSQILFAAACTAASILLRLLTDLTLPGAGPFALTMPAVLFATLFGRWQAGILTLAASSLYAWYFVLPVAGSFHFETVADGPRVFVNVAAGVFVVILAELFRRTVRRALNEREMLLLELEHRVKNNFASMASVLRMQAREAEGVEAQQALQSTLGRIESYSRAHSFLYRNFDQTGTLDMRLYLRDLCAALSSSFGDGRSIAFDCEADSAALPRDRAIGIGLLVNEVATNSIKHAFTEGRAGVIRVRFTVEPEVYRLCVSDNGSGIKAGGNPHSLGMKLIEALTLQANGTSEIASDETGTTFVFRFAR